MLGPIYEFTQGYGHGEKNTNPTSIIDCESSTTSRGHGRVARVLVTCYTEF